jgi:hypothetical protein
MPLFCDAHPASNAAALNAISSFFIRPFFLLNIVPLSFDPTGWARAQTVAGQTHRRQAISIALTRRLVIVVIIVAIVVVVAAGRLQVALRFQRNVVHDLRHTLGLTCDFARPVLLIIRVHEPA